MPEDGRVVSAAKVNARHNQKISAADRLIVALDVPAIDRARALVDELEGSVSFFKVGLHLQMLEGSEGLITDLIDRGKHVFVDYKWTDIPQSVRGGVLAAAARGVHFVTIQGNGDVTEEMLKAAAQARDEASAAANGGHRVKLFFVTVLTSLSDADVIGMGIGSSVQDVVLQRARMAYNAGLDGVIASGQEAALIKALATTRRFEVTTPGIRPAGTSSDDQKRVTTPFEAVSAGADYLVIGRPILQAADRRKAAEGIISEMQAAFDGR